MPHRSALTLGVLLSLPQLRVGAGKPVAKSHYLTGGGFSEGLATRYVPETKTIGYIDTTGKLAIPARFEHASDFSDGLALVRKTPNSG